MRRARCYIRRVCVSVCVDYFVCDQRRGGDGKIENPFSFFFFTGKFTMCLRRTELFPRDSEYTYEIAQRACVYTLYTYTIRSENTYTLVGIVVVNQILVGFWFFFFFLGGVFLWLCVRQLYPTVDDKLKRDISSQTARDFFR